MAVDLHPSISKEIKPHIVRHQCEMNVKPEIDIYIVCMQIVSMKDKNLQEAFR